MSFRSRALLGALVAAPLAAPLSAPALAQNLTIGIGGSPTSLDPHFYNASPNISLTMHLFDRLVEQDAQARIQPALAESWRPVSDTVWEFRLRRGVTWHDGRDFTADDVAFTIERAPNVPEQPGRLRRLRARHPAGGGGGPADDPLPHRRAAPAAAGRTRLDPGDLAPCRPGREHGGLQCRPRGDRHGALSPGLLPVGRPDGVRAQRRLLEGRRALGASLLPLHAERRLPHGGAAGGRCGPDRPGAPRTTWYGSGGSRG
jgi:hypothetical protein